MIWGLLFHISWTLHKVETFSALTVIRQWHELHVLQKKPHDFENMICPPKSEDIYMAAVNAHEIKSIAYCKEVSGNLTISNIAYAPDCIENSMKLLALLNEANFFPDWKHMKHQPRLYYDQLYTLIEHDDAL